MTPDTAGGTQGRLAVLSEEVRALRERLRQGGAPERVDAHHQEDKLTARERVDLLLDGSEPVFELGLLLSSDDETPSAAGVVTCVGRVMGREVVVVAHDATVADGAWSPGTVQKILRAQEVAMRCRVPIAYLVDGGSDSPAIQGRVFPGQYGAGRVLYYAAVMRRHLSTPQLAAVMGPCVGGAAYLPALSDVILMVEGASFMALGGPGIVRTVTGREVSREELGGAELHTAVSGVAHYSCESDAACVDRLRQLLEELPEHGQGPDLRAPTPPRRLAYELYDLVPDDPRQPYDVRATLECILDGDPFEEFQPDYAPEMVCGTGVLEGVGVGVIANARGLLGSTDEGDPRFGGTIYADSARKVAYFVETAGRQGMPLLFLQDVSGFMVGPSAERAGILRAGADLVEAMATAAGPKISLILNHASGAGHYAMAGQGFDPDFSIALPTGRLGGGDGSGATPMSALTAAAKGLVDEVLLPEELRPALGLLLRAALCNPGVHLGSFQVGPA